MEIPTPAHGASEATRVPARLGQGPAVLEVTNLTKRFPGKRGGRATTVLRDVSLELPERGFLSIVGASGSGKSTLLQIVAGLQRATSGSVRHRDRVIDGPTRDIIYVFQNYTHSIFPWLTVRKNIAFGLQARGDSTKDAIERAERFTELVSLAGYEDYYPKELSGGMQQRVALARALACEPSILLMDEPFSAVDAFTRIRLQDLLVRLWETLDLSIVFVTHDVEEAVFLSSRVAVLEGRPATIGRVVDIQLGYPRDQLTTRESPQFLSYRHEILSKIVTDAADHEHTS